MTRIALLLLLSVAVATAAPPPKSAAASVVFVVDRGLAKHAAAFGDAVVVLDRGDLVSLVAYDQFEVILRDVIAAQRGLIREEAANMKPGIGTDIRPALVAAWTLLADAKGAKHVIVVSASTITRDGYADTAKRLHEAKITVTAIGAPGSNRDQLAALTGKQGRIYMIDDARFLANILATELRRIRPPRDAR